MEALDPQTYAWAKRCGLTDERIRFLLACPKYTRCVGHQKFPRKQTENHHLQKLGDCWWFRLRRRKQEIIVNIGKDLNEARKKRDEMLAAFDAGKPVPYLT